MAMGVFIIVGNILIRVSSKARNERVEDAANAKQPSAPATLSDGAKLPRRTIARESAVAVSIKSAIIAFPVLAMALASPVAAASFADVLRAMAADHPRLRSAEQTARAGRAEVRASEAAFRPQLAVFADAGFNRNRLTDRANTALLPGLRASQLVYDGGRTGAEVEQRRARAEALGVQQRQELALLGARLSEAFLEWSRQQALLQIAEDQVAALGKLKATVDAIASYDRGRASDVALVATRLSQAEATRDQRRVAIADARALVRQAAASDVEPSGDMPSVVPFLPPSLAAAFDRIDTTPMVAVAQLQSREAEAGVRAARAWWRPQLSVEAASYSQQRFDGSANIFGAVDVRLRATISPIDGGGGAARAAAARATASAAEFDVAQARRSLRDEIERQWTAVATRGARLGPLSTLVDNTDASRDVVFEQFRIGRRSILDLLSFEIDRFSARVQLESERRDQLAAQYRLLAALDLLAPSFVPATGPA